MNTVPRPWAPRQRKEGRETGRGVGRVCLRLLILTSLLGTLAKHVARPAAPFQIPAIRRRGLNTISCSLLAIHPPASGCSTLTLLGSMHQQFTLLSQRTHGVSTSRISNQRISCLLWLGTLEAPRSLPWKLAAKRPRPWHIAGHTTDSLRMACLKKSDKHVAFLVSGLIKDILTDARGAPNLALDTSKGWLFVNIIKHASLSFQSYFAPASRPCRPPSYQEHMDCHIGSRTLSSRLPHFGTLMPLLHHPALSMLLFRWRQVVGISAKPRALVKLTERPGTDLVPASRNTLRQPSVKKDRRFTAPGIKAGGPRQLGPSVPSPSLLDPNPIYLSLSPWHLSFCDPQPRSPPHAGTKSRGELLDPIPDFERQRPWHKSAG